MKSKLRRIAAVLALVQGIMLPAAVCFAASITLQETRIENYEQELSIPVALQCTQNEEVSSVECSVSFDPNSIQFTNSTITQSLINAQKIVAESDNKKGTVKILIYGLNKTSIPSGVFFYLNFYMPQAALNTAFDIAIQTAVASSSSAQSVPMSIVNETVSCGDNFPQITIVSPSENQAISRTEATLRGTVSDESMSEVHLTVSNADGTTTKTALVSNNAFSADIEFANGKNVITATAENEVGALGVARRTCIVDTTILGVPEIINQRKAVNTKQFRVEWTDESESGAVEYEIKKNGGSLRPSGCTESLISYWKLDEAGNVWSDEQGLNTISGIGAIARVAGIYDSGLLLNSSYAICPDNVQKQLEGMKALSMAVWINFNGNSNLQPMTILSKFSSKIGYKLYINTANQVVFEGHDGLGNSMGSYSATPLALKEWNHIVCTWSGTHVKMYVNGELKQDTVSNVTLLPNNTAPFIVGGECGATGEVNAGRLFRGSVDEVALWIRALSDSEISSLYQSGINGKSGSQNVKTTMNYYDESVMQDGTYTYEIRALSALNVPSQYSAPYTVVVDTQAPVQPQIANSTYITNQSLLMLSGTKTADTEKIMITVEEANVGTLSYPSSSTWSVPITFTQNGVHTISAIGVDEAGNNSTPSQVSVQYDTVAPSIESIVDTAQGKTIGEGTLISITVHAESSCNTAFKIKGISSYSTMSELSPGVYQGSYVVKKGDVNISTCVVIQSKDKAGNCTEVETGKNFIIDTIAPLITMVSEDSQGRALKENDVITVTMKGEVGQIGLFSIDSIIGSVAMKEGPAGTYTGAYSVKKGDNVSSAKISGTIMDVVGNKSAQDALSTVSIDTVAPVVTIVSPTNGQMITARSVSLQGYVNDENTNTIVIDGDEYPVTNKSFSVKLSIENEGYNTIQINASDKAGNIGSASCTVKLEFPPQTPTITSPVKLLQPASFRLEWTDESASGAVRYEIKKNGGSLRPSGCAEQLVSYWKFDEAGTLWQDVNSNNNLNGVGTISSESGIFNSAVSLKQSYAICADATQTNLENMSAMSIGVWIKFATPPDLQPRTILSKFGPGSGYKLYLNGSRLVVFEGHDGKGQSIGAYCATPLVAGQWYYVACTWDGSSAKMYLNGELKQTAAGAMGVLPDNSMPFLLGAECASTGEINNGRIFLGTIDEVAIWKRSLTATEIASMYQTGVSGNGAANTVSAVTNYYDEVITQDGTYTYEVRALSENNLPSEYSSQCKVVVDTCPPQNPTIDGGSLLTNQFSVIVRGIRTVDTEKIKIMAANAVVGDVSFPSTTTWNSTITYNKDGAYEVQVFAEDAAGNKSGKVYKNIVIDTVAPLITMTSPEVNYAKPLKAITIKGTIDDNAIKTAELRIVNAAGNSTKTLTVTNGVFEYPYALSRGVNTFTLSATDAAGNVGTKIFTAAYSNTKPLVMIPIGNKAVGYGDPVTFTVKVVDQNLIDKELLRFSASNLPGAGTANPATFNADTGVFSWTPTKDQLGLYQNITFTVEDDNKLTSESIKVVVQSYDLGVNDFMRLMGNSRSNQVVVEDFNQDGYKDIYMVNVGENTLMMNNGDATFTEMAAVYGVNDTGNGVSACVLDYNKDGAMDLYVVNKGSNVLYRNDGNGYFSDVTSLAKVGDAGNGIAAYAFDFNRDGHTDILNLNESNCVLYINNGNGTFADKAQEAGIAQNAGAEMACIADVDNDADNDIYIVNSGENKLFVNGGNGTFEDKTAISGVGNEMSDCTTRIYDFDYDGDNDIVINNHLFDVYYYNNGNTTFKKVLFSKAYNPLANGKLSLFLDYNNDGDMDVLIVDENSKYVQGLGNILYRNNGDGSFSDVTVQTHLL